MNYLKAIEYIEELPTAERATPRIFLGALYFFDNNYSKATVFFKQAEALAAGTEGKDSILYLMASYNLNVIDF